jgi:hypothetical protein
MQPFLGRCANSYDPTGIHLVLNGLADECCGMLAHLIAYVGAPALLAIIGIHLWDELPAGAAVEPPPERAGAWPCARTRRLPSVSSICQKKQRLIRSFGIPRAAARTSFAECLKKEGRTNSGCI